MGIELSIIYRFDFNIIGHEGLQGRAHIHKSGIETQAYSGVEEAYSHLNDIFKRDRLHQIKSQANDFDYAHAVLWGKGGGTKMIDFFGYDAGGVWEENPNVFSWSMQNGIIVPVPSNNIANHFCGDDLILLGEEEIYRRTLDNLTEYLQSPPYIPGLPPGNDFSGSRGREDLRGILAKSK